jgi:alpha-tubulin suppressor-like RCC1 family protein
VIYGTTVFLHVAAAGSTPLHYQWRFNGSDLPGGTNAILRLPAAQLDQSGAYSVIVSNAYGIATSRDMMLSVTPLAITVQPKSDLTYKGATVTLNVAATSPSLVNYQWRFNDNDLPGALGNALTLTNLQLNQAGLYSAVVSNEFGSLTSVPARVSVVLVAPWGESRFGLTNVPASATNLVALAGGNSSTLGLRRDGNVLAWWNNGAGQAGIPGGLTNIIAIAGGYAHTIALQAGGTVVAWGNNGYGQTSVPFGLTNVLGIACGGYHSLALKEDGTVLAWGNNGSGQTNVPAALANTVAIAAGGYHCLALRADGAVIAWGDNSFGQTNVPAGLTNVIATAGGWFHSLAVTADGRVIAWGDNAYGQTNVPPDVTNVAGIACGGSHCLALKADGTVVAWGNNASGQTNVLGYLSGTVALAGGYSHSLALLGDGPPFLTAPLLNRSVVYGTTAHLSVAAIGPGPLTYQWRFNGTNLPGATNGILALNNIQFDQAGQYSIVVSNAFGNVTSPEMTLDVVPLRIVNQPESQSTFRGDLVDLRVVAQGQALNYQWQFNTNDLPGATNSALQLTNAQTHQSGSYSVVISNLFGSITSSVAAVSIGEVAAWGDNYSGQNNLPHGLTNIVAVADGAFHSLVLKKDGTIIGWGQNTYGQLNIPAGLSNVVAISAGLRHSLALLANGTVLGWSDSIANAPTGLSNVVAIAAGSDYSLALKADGTVTAWGINDDGQGNVPANLGNCVALAARYHSSLALTAEGRAVGWGWNYYGQTNVPVLTDAIAIAPGYYHSAAVKADGIVVTWGDNTFGQRAVPTGLIGVIAISCGETHNLALKSDGTVVLWGSQTNIPSRLRNVVAISAGNTHNLALVGDGSSVLAAPISNPMLVSNAFTVTLPTWSGKVYSLEYKASLSPSTWTALPLVAGDGGLKTLTDSTATGAQRFYRVRQW